MTEQLMNGLFVNLVGKCFHFEVISHYGGVGQGRKPEYPGKKPITPVLRTSVIQRNSGDEI